MAKRRKKEPEKSKFHYILERRWTVFWVIAVLISILFGYTWGYQQAEPGDPWNAILRALAYGGGAFIVISVSYYLNRKLKGL
jgi:hypothetical protein